MSDAVQSRRPAVRHVVGLALLALLASVLAWAVGLLWYIRLIDAAPPPVPPAEGIVALTGGAGRVETALQLLAKGQAAHLLLSGIGGGARLPELDDRSGVDAARLSERITLGRDALSTRGNAVETAAWVRQQGIRSLIVVTAAYHMPRAMLELRRELPGIQLYPVPVRSPGQTGWRRLRLLAVEFTKFLGAEAGMSLFAPERHNRQR